MAKLLFRGRRALALRASFGLGALVALMSCLGAIVPRVKPTATLAPRAPGAKPSPSPLGLSVVRAAPQGAVANRKEPGVSILFSRAMRAVETLEDAGLPAVQITTKHGAPARGAFLWAGTRGLLFAPEAGLPGGSDFVVTVAAGTAALDGSKLDKPYTFEFSTQGPRIASISTNGQAPKGGRIGSNPRFVVSFDQPVDPAAVAAATSLRVFAGDGDKGESVAVTGARVGTDSAVVALSPQKPLVPDRGVDLTIAASLRGTDGPRPMADPYSQSFRTYGPLRLVDMYCPRIEPNGRCRAGGDVKALLSNPVAPDEFRAHLKMPKIPVRPLPKTAAQPRKIEPSEEHWLGVAPKLGDRYRVTLTRGMRDIYGQRLAKDASFDVEIEAPLATPAAQASAEAKVAPPPRPAAPPGDTRPRRERLPYELSLGITGSVFEALTNSGVRSHRVPVGAVNVPTYSRAAVALSEAQAAQFLASPGRGDFLARNGIARSWLAGSRETNERAVSLIDLDQGLAAQHGRGMMLLDVAPAGGSSQKTALVAVTDLGVSAKLGTAGSVVWVTRLSTGEPVPSATITVRTSQPGETASVVTDADGMAVLKPSELQPFAKGRSGYVRPDVVLVVRSGDDFTIAHVARSSAESRITSAWSSLGKEARWAGLIFADRGVYRPGETAKVAGIVRVVDDAGLRAIAGRTVRVNIRDVNGEQIFDGRAASDEFGGFSLDAPIPKTAPLGYATLGAFVAAGGIDGVSDPGEFSESIRILHFQPNPFKVTADAAQSGYVRGDTAAFRMRGDYLYGAPMAGAAITTTVTRQTVSFEPPGTEGFTSSDDLFAKDRPETAPRASELDNADGVLDPDGQFTRNVELSFADQTRTERIVLSATVRDVARREVSARAQALLHPAEIYLALRLPKDRFVAAGARLRPEIMAIAPDGTRRPDIATKLELLERRWTGVVAEQPDGTPMRSTGPVDTVVATCSATTKATPVGCDLLVPRAGYYLVRASAEDGRNNPVHASFYVYGTEESPSAPSSAAWATSDDRSLKLEASKSLYDIGETAKIAIRSPFRSAEALVTVERNGVLYRKVVPVEGPLPVVSIPIEPSFYPNAYVGVHMVRGRIQAPPQSGADLGAPDFRIGYMPLKVNADAHRLKVSVAAPKPEYGPGEEADVAVRIQDASGKGVESWVTFYAVDEGVLDLTTYRTPDPLPAFIGSRKLATFTLDNRELLARILPMKDGEPVRALGFEYAVAKSGYDKGEEGGDGAPDTATRKDFRTTAFFEAGRKTDREGSARFRFKLPDNLTTFRLMAVAAARDDKFGAGEGKVATFRPLMADPALPRALRVGDAFDASVAISAKLGTDSRRKAAPIAVEVRIAAQGLTLMGPAIQKLTVLPGKQVEARFPVRADAPSEATVKFEVHSALGTDKVEVKRKIELPTSVELVAVRGEATEPVALQLRPLVGIRPDRGGLDVRVASSALVGLGSTFDRLLDYPYDCVEQLASRTLPILAELELGRAFGARIPKDTKAAVEAYLAEIVKSQHGDGGFSFWGKEDESVPWLSAYALWALGLANEQKYFVPAEALARGREHLQYQLANVTRSLVQDPDAPTPTANDAGPSDPAQPAYSSGALIGFVLSNLGAPNPGALNVLFDARKGQRLFAQAALLAAMVQAKMSPAQQKTLAQEIEGHLHRGPSDVDIDEPQSEGFGDLLESRTRTLAMIEIALLAYDPSHPLGRGIATRLLSSRKDDAWRTTQENAWSLLALGRYRKAQESGSKAFSARVFLDKSQLLEASFEPGALREDRLLIEASTLAGQKPELLTIDVDRPGKLYYEATLRYATTVLPTVARDEGLFVRKYVRAMPASAIASAISSLPSRSAESAVAGDLVLVDLFFETAEPRVQIVLDDPLAAGVEALDFDLDTTRQVPVSATRQGPTGWLGTTFVPTHPRREIRDDRVLHFFDHLSPGMYRVQYVARATSLGDFVVPPTRIEGMYEPEAYGSTPATRFQVRPKG